MEKLIKWRLVVKDFQKRFHYMFERNFYSYHWKRWVCKSIDIKTVLSLSLPVSSFNVSEGYLGKLLKYEYRLSDACHDI